MAGSDPSERKPQLSTARWVLILFAVSTLTALVGAIGWHANRDTTATVFFVFATIFGGAFLAAAAPMGVVIWEGGKLLLWLMAICAAGFSVLCAGFIGPAGLILGVLVGPMAGVALYVQLGGFVR